MFLSLLKGSPANRLKIYQYTFIFKQILSIQQFHSNFQCRIFTNIIYEKKFDIKWQDILLSLKSKIWSQNIPFTLMINEIYLFYPNICVFKSFGGIKPGGN